MTAARKLTAIGALVALLAAAGAAGWWRGASAERDRIVAQLPPTPDLSSASAEAGRRIEEADGRAHSLLSAGRGLAALARLYHANGFLEQAVQCYTALEQLEPREPHWFYYHGTLLAGFGELEPALTLWQRVIELAPPYEPVRLRLGDALLKGNRRDEAAATYADVLKRNPQNAYAQLGLARIDLELQRWTEARDRLEAVVTQTNYELGYDLIVSVYERLGDRDRAAAIRGTKKASGAYRDPADPWLDELLDDCYDPYRLSVAAGLMAREAAPKSVQLLERALQLAPDDIGTHFQLATLSLQQGNIERARQELERCTTLSPEFSDGWAQLSALQVRLGEPDAAARTLAEGLRHCPNSPALHLMRARNLRAAGRLDEAIREFNLSSSLRPNEADTFLELGNMLIELGRTDEGLAQIETAVQVEPGNPMALGILAFNAIVNGDEARAREWLARVGNQPRVRREQFEQLLAAYRQQFGHDWAPPSS